MALSNKKRKSIKRLGASLSPAEISRKLRIPVKEVEHVLDPELHARQATQRRSSRRDRAQRALNWASILFVALSPWVPALQRRGCYYWANQPQMLFIQACVPAFLFAWALLASLPTGRREFRLSGLELPAGLFLVWSLVSLLWAVNVPEGVGVWVHWLACFAAHVLVLQILRDVGDVRRLMALLFASMAAASVLGVIQGLFGVSPFPQIGPPASVFANRNMAAQFVAAGIPLGVCGCLGGRPARERWLHAIGLAACAAYLFFTWARAAWLGAAAALVSVPLLLAVLRVRPRDVLPRTPAAWAPAAVALLLFTGLVALPYATPLGAALPKKSFSILASQVRQAMTPAGEEPGAEQQPAGDRPSSAPAAAPETAAEAPRELVPAAPSGDTFLSSANIRLAYYRNTLPMVRRRWLAGVGLGNWKIHYPLYHRGVAGVGVDWTMRTQQTYLHSDYLQVAAELGLIGLLLGAWTLVTLFRVGGRVRQRPDGAQAPLQAVGVGAALVGILVNSATSFCMFVAIPPFVLAVGSAVLARLGDQDTACQAGAENGVQERAAGWTGKRRVLAVAAAVFAVWSCAAAVAACRRRAAGVSYAVMRLNVDRSDHGATVRAARAVLRHNPFRKQALFHVGVGESKSGGLEEAAAALQEYLALYPNDVRALYNLGVCHQNLRAYDAALEVCERLIRDFPAQAHGHYLKGTVLAAQGHDEEAYRAMRTALSLASGSERPEFLCDFGVIAGRIREFDVARAALEQAVVSNPADWRPRWFLGNLLLLTFDERDQAREVFLGALDQGPPPAKAARIKTLLEQTR